MAEESRPAGRRLERRSHRVAAPVCRVGEIDQAPDIFPPGSRATAVRHGDSRWRREHERTQHRAITPSRVNEGTSAMPTALNQRQSLRPGRVVRRVLRADPGMEYFVYIPRSAAPGAPVLVAVHGISRNPRDMAKSLAALAEDRGFIVVAPHFTVERFGDYQRLGRE